MLAKLIRAWLDNGKRNPVFIPKDEMMFSVLGGKKEKGENASLFEVGAFNQNALLPSKRDINNHSKCPIEVEYEEVEDTRSGKGGNYPTLGWNWNIEERPGQSVELYIDKIDMTQDLIDRGFTPSLAQKVIHDYSWNTIRRNIAYFDSPSVKKKDKTSDQLGKILYNFIIRDEEKKNRKELVPVTSRESEIAMASLFPTEETEPIDKNSPFYKELTTNTGIGKILEELEQKRKEQE